MILAQVFFCGGCRYRVTAQPQWPVHKVKQALFDGGIARANKSEGVRNTPGIQSWSDLVRLAMHNTDADIFVVSHDPALNVVTS